MTVGRQARFPALYGSLKKVSLLDPRVVPQRGCPPFIFLRKLPRVGHQPRRIAGAIAGPMGRPKKAAAASRANGSLAGNKGKIVNGKDELLVATAKTAPTS